MLALGYPAFLYRGWSIRYRNVNNLSNPDLTKEDGCGSIYTRSQSGAESERRRCAMRLHGQYGVWQIDK